MNKEHRDLVAFDNEQRRIHQATYIAGFDEAGRGPLAGPVSTAGVVLPPDYKNDLINDSKKLTDKQYNDYSRRPEIKKKYRNHWRKVRERYFAMHPYCEQCFKEGKMVMADEVHHIIPVSRGGTHEASNLMSLCRSCHNKIHHDLGDR